ncbi:hypothetical protein POPTR_006G028700v4 [Populus trichocarpa]|uniref:Uncharacterized protein n=1 Tax=Populus trichocarpa TaxID=3694 RepID=U7E2G7_POPTR|nr:hypothetical protein POPTR_006G028700v4 [Populus trichocarpa]
MQKIHTLLPPGFIFRPTGEQLIGHYLHHKVHGRLTVEADDMIKDYNLYGAEEPWELFNKVTGHKEGDDVLYCFTTLDKKTAKSTKRMRRTVGTNGGKWHGDSLEEVIYRLDNREFKGTKRRFRYQNKQRRDKHGCWTLLEYGSQSISDNIVICELKMSDHGLKESRKRKSMWPLPSGDMGLEAPAIVNIEPALRLQPQQANFIQEPMISEHQQVAFASFSDNHQKVVLQSEAVFDGYGRSQNIVESFYEHPKISFEPMKAEESKIIKNQEITGLADFPTQDSFENAAAIINSEPMTSAYENQQMEPASYNGGGGVCPAGDNAVTPENAAPAVSAIPAMGHSIY